MKTKACAYAARAALVMAFGTPALAQADDAAAVQLRAKLVEAYPATQFGEVRPAVIDGLFEVELGRNLAYIESSGRYFFFGHIYDMQEQVDVTADRKSEQALNTRVDLAQLSQADFFEVRTGTPTLTVFSDPLCGYCKALEKALASVPGIGVRIALLAYQPGAEGVAHRIRCAPDPGQAWREWMLEDVAPPRASQDCSDDGLNRNAQLARSLGINGTPTLISDDGRMQAGALEADSIKSWLAQTEAESPKEISQ